MQFVEEDGRVEEEGDEEEEVVEVVTRSVNYWRYPDVTIKNREITRSPHGYERVRQIF